MAVVRNDRYSYSESSHGRIDVFAINGGVFIEVGRDTGYYAAHTCASLPHSEIPKLIDALRRIHIMEAGPQVSPELRVRDANPPRHCQRFDGCDA